MYDEKFTRVPVIEHIDTSALKRKWIEWNLANLAGIFQSDCAIFEGDELISHELLKDFERWSQFLMDLGLEVRHHFSGRIP